MERKGLRPHGGGASLKADNCLRRNSGPIWDTTKCAIPRGQQRKICVKKLLDGGQFQCFELKKRIQIWGWVQKQRNLRSNQVKRK